MTRINAPNVYPGKSGKRLRNGRLEGRVQADLLVLLKQHRKRFKKYRTKKAPTYMQKTFRRFIQY